MTKRVLLATLLVVGMMGSAAFADTAVSFYTTDTLGGPNAGDNPYIWLTFDSISKYDPNTTTIHTGKTANSTLGTFEVDELGLLAWLNGKADGYQDVKFTLTIHETKPQSGTGEFDAVIDGDIWVDSSDAYVQFSKPSVQIGNVLYTLDKQKLGLPTPGSVCDPNDSTVNVTLSTVPEPGSLALLASGLLGAGGYLRRRLLHV